MKQVQFITVLALACCLLSGCGDGRDTVQPGSRQWAAMHDTTGADMRAGKKVTIHVPASMYKPGAGGPPPPNVTIVVDQGK